MKTQRSRLSGNGPVRRPVDHVGADCKPPPKDFGVPTQEQYDNLIEEYIKSLSVRKREKCLISQAMFDDIWDVLHNPSDPKIRTPQFRFWVRKMFTLGSATKNPLLADEETDVVHVILHEGRPVAVKEQVYDILSYYHALTGHAGRDRTMAEVKQHYAWIPKEVVARFVKVCPTCTFKRTGIVTSPPSTDSIAEPVSFHGTRVLRPSPSQESEEGTVSSSSSQVVSLPSSEDGFIVGLPASARYTGDRTAYTLASLMESRILPTPVLSPILRSPPLGSPTLSADPRKWLADLAMQPGPALAGSSHKFPPLDLRRAHSETGVDPVHRPASRITLPPLMKALSENMADYDIHRPGFNVPNAFSIPARVPNGEGVNLASSDGGLCHSSEEHLNGYSHIDPILLGDFLPVVQDYDAHHTSNAGLSGTHTSCALPYDLRQSVIIPLDIDYRVAHMERSGSQDSVSSFASSAVSVRSQGSTASFPTGRRVSNTSAKTHNSLRQSDSFDAQDWESTYCLEEV